MCQTQEDSDESDESYCIDAYPSNYFTRIRQIAKSITVLKLRIQQDNTIYNTGSGLKVCSLNELYELAQLHPFLLTLPDPGYRDLPPGFSPDRERRIATSMLLDEKIEVALRAFYVQMNETAFEIGLKNSNFASAHGMFTPENYSTAYDIAILTKHAIEKHKLLDKICNTKTFSCESKINKEYL